VIRIVEVGPRDGLQNEKATIATEVKVAYIDALSETGLVEIEASAFVSPKWIPQLADAGEVFARIHRKKGVVYSALVPNVQGLERAMSAKADKIAVFTAASESFNRKNINATIAESIERFAPVIAKARGAKLPVRGYVSTAWWCPYEGKIAPEKTVDVVKRLVDAGCDDLSIGDTIGKAECGDVRDVVERLLKVVPAERLAMHFHDTYGHAVENALEAQRLGITTFDSSAGGIGGCPYAPGASGNVATEALAAALKVDLNLKKLAAAKSIIAGALGRTA
jgi:hydroxymethylglutaryl-CoA lyase